MNDFDFIDARRFTFAPFPHPLHPEETGDSGVLEMATAKQDPNERYIVKRGYAELGCNEFMYHKVAGLLGLYTQTAKLVSGSKEYRRAAAIRYVPDAKLYDLDAGSAENLKAFIMFEALYIILNESDSHEYYLDGQGRLFKLDNAASFTVEETTIMWMEGKFHIPDINAPLNAVGYDYYGLALDMFTEKHGQEAADAYLSVIRRFAELDTTELEAAYAVLDKQYPKMLKLYYDKAIRIRKDTCRRFLSDIGA